MRLLLVMLLALSGCNVVHFNHWLLRKRFSRAGVDEHYVDLPSGRMRYFEGGQGPPLVLLHGFGYGAVENWSAQVAVLSGERHLDREGDFHLARWGHFHHAVQQPVYARGGRELTVTKAARDP